MRGRGLSVSNVSSRTRVFSIMNLLPVCIMLLPFSYPHRVFISLTLQEGRESTPVVMNSITALRNDFLLFICCWYKYHRNGFDDENLHHMHIMYSNTKIESLNTRFVFVPGNTIPLLHNQNQFTGQLGWDCTEMRVYSNYMLIRGAEVGGGIYNINRSPNQMAPHSWYRISLQNSASHSCGYLADSDWILQLVLITSLISRLLVVTRNKVTSCIVFSSVLLFRCCGWGIQPLVPFDWFSNHPWRTEVSWHIYTPHCLLYFCNPTDGWVLIRSALLLALV